MLNKQKLMDIKEEKLAEIEQIESKLKIERNKVFKKTLPLYKARQKKREIREQKLIKSIRLKIKKYGIVPVVGYLDKFTPVRMLCRYCNILKSEYIQIMKVLNFDFKDAKQMNKLYKNWKLTEELPYIYGKRD